MRIPFPLSLLTLFSTVGIYLITISVDQRAEFLDFHYFDLIFVMPGLIFSGLVYITHGRKVKFLQDGLLFLIISTALYSLTYAVSWGLFYPGVILIPSLGAVGFLWMIKHFLSIQFPKEAFQAALFAGPISGITGIVASMSYDFMLITYVPIIVWWIFMAVLIDHHQPNSAQHV